MDPLGKLKAMAGDMDLEPAEEAPLRVPLALRQSAPCGAELRSPAARKTMAKANRRQELGVYQAALPGGKSVPLLKTMLTTACERDCVYCPFRAGRNYRRQTFKPEEMAQVFMDMRRAGLVEGLFLSSGIIGGGVRTQDKLLATAEILRLKMGFQGFLHLKVMPGAEREQVARAMQLADRLSVNLEAPNAGRLQPLAPRKEFERELLQPLRWMEEIRRRAPAGRPDGGRWPSSTTQFVVGGDDESDLELLQTSEFLFQKLRLSRTYFSAFRPIVDTPLENRPAENPWRQHRLYQASFLLRDYGFTLEDLPFLEGGKLPLARDPKLAWAWVNLQAAPVEVNSASRGELLRVPGIGPKGASAILRARRLGKLRALNDLKSIGVRANRLAPFVQLDGRRPPWQMPLEWPLANVA